jgi:hypothetical protein
VPKLLDSKTFNLSKNCIIEQISDKSFSICLYRKSRIIMKDADSIIQKALKIKNIFPDSLIFVKTTAPVCRKTKAFLLKNQIEIISV